MKSTRLADYYELAKPGIAFMATFSALAGFLVGSHGNFSIGRLLHCLLGTLLTAGGACALNMVFERDLDAKMDRTRRRPLPQNRLKPGEALFVGLALSFSGILYLAWFLNIITAILGALSCSIYLYVYTPLKKISSLCTVVGAIAGALPPMMGWTAASGSLREDGWTLFVIIFLWQFPHFLSLAWMYREDYAKAGLHMLPWINEINNRERSERVTGAWVAFTSAGLLFAGSLPTILGQTGVLSLGSALLSGFFLTYYSFRFLVSPTGPQAKRLFLASLLYVPLLFTCIILDRWMVLKNIFPS